MNLMRHPLEMALQTSLATPSDTSEMSRNAETSLPFRLLDLLRDLVGATSKNVHEIEASLCAVAFPQLASQGAPGGLLGDPLGLPRNQRSPGGSPGVPEGITIL